MLIIDDSFDLGDFKIEIEKNKYGTIRVNGKTEREMLREYREKYGEDDYRRLKAKLEANKRRAAQNISEETEGGTV